MAITDQDKLDTPDLTQAVNAVVTTFAAFVAISLTDFFDGSITNALPRDMHLWMFIALVALLLRYIVGSAIHLNRAYGVRKGPGREGPLLPSTGLFVKDLVFLVAFGYVAIEISHSIKFVHFLQQAAWFVGFGLVWSITDPVFRRLFLGGRIAHAPFDKLAMIWTAIDAGQLLVTGLLAQCLGRDARTAFWLAMIYGALFFVDMWVLLRR